MGRSSRPLHDTSSNSLSFSYSFGMKRLIMISIIAIIAACIISSLITYYVSRSPKPFDPMTDRLDSIPDASTISGPSAESLRLPSTLSPENYRLQLKVYLPGYGANIDKVHNMTADADLTITMKVIQGTRDIVLNSKELIYTDDSFKVDKKTSTGTLSSVPIQGFTIEKELEKITIILKEELNEGDIVFLKVKYRTKILDILGGLYVNTYKDEKGNNKLLAMTQMESTDARRMVPCLDEPAFKATWDVAVEHPLGTVALSNGYESAPIQTTTGWQLTSFKQTPKMSSYLLAIVVGDISKTEMTNANGVLVRVWARHESIKDTQFALESGAKVLAAYDDYFGIKFPLEKMDMVACPDFSAGAMENWGLVTYRENDLLYNENLYGMNEKLRVTTTVAHELAHQWFGNLVTMEWWDDLWLNEGFATLVEYDGGDIISDNNFHLEEEFVRDAQDTAFVYDSLPTSQPLSFKIDRAIEVNEAFNAISYDKGASVLRMIRAVLGPEVFKEGLEVYLNKHKYGNARAADLWSALQVAANNHKIQGPRNGLLDVSHFARQWTTQMGYPVVIAKRFNETHSEFSQERYKSTNGTQERLKYRNPEFGFKWDIPLWFTRGEGDITELAWIDRNHPLIMPIPEDSLIVMNIDSLGFYRTHYEDGGWQRIGKSLFDDHKRFSTKTRSRIISDIFAMAHIGRVKYEDLFDMMRQYIKKEDDTLPIQMFISELNIIMSYMSSEPVDVDLKKYKRELLQPIYSKVDKNKLISTFAEDLPFSENSKMNTIINGMCTADDPSCVADSFKDYQDNFMALCSEPNSVASNCSKVAAPLRVRTYCDGVRYSTPGEYDKILQFLYIEKNQMEVRSLTRAITCTMDIAILKRSLLLALDPKNSLIRSQDIGSLFNYVGINQIARPFLFDFLFDHWDIIYERFKDDTSILSSIIKGCIFIRTPQQIQQLVTWRNEHSEAVSLNVFSEKISNAYKVIDWNKEYLDEITSYFAKRR